MGSRSYAKAGVAVVTDWNFEAKLTAVLPTLFLAFERLSDFYEDSDILGSLPTELRPSGRNRSPPVMYVVTLLLPTVAARRRRRRRFRPIQPRLLRAASARSIWRSASARAFTWRLS